MDCFECLHPRYLLNNKKVKTFKKSFRLASFCFVFFKLFSPSLGGHVARGGN